MEVKRITKKSKIGAFYLCPRCSGVGIEEDKNFGGASPCSVCEGKGRISWVDAIIKGIKIHS